MKKLLPILLILFCAGCEKAQDYIADNKELASGGTIIGVFPDGTKVRSYDLYVSRELPSGSRGWGSQQLLVIEQKGEKDKAILINGQLYAPAESE